MISFFRYRFIFNRGFLATFVVSLASIVAMSVGTLKAYALDSYSISMTPSSTEIHAAPGSSATSTFTVVNQGLNSYPIALSVAPYHVVGDTYDPIFTTLPGKTDASAWIHFTGAINPTLDAGKVQTITYSLNVPSGAEPGGYYAVIFAETNPATSGNGVTAHNRVGDILYITVDGPVANKGTLQAPTPDVSSIIFDDKTDLGVLVGDTGGIHFLTAANISVTSLFGNTVFSAHLERYVLPQTERLVSTSWTSLPPIGIYKINRDATVAGSDQHLATKYVFIIRPWLLAVMVAFIVAVVTIGVIMYRRKPTQVVKRNKD